MHIAINAIKKVPVNSGIAPKAPEEPIWSSLIGICGLQWVPNKNSETGTVEKNLFDSKITDKNMPIVINIATDEQINKNNSINFSNFSLALNSCLILKKVIKAVNKNIKIDTMYKMFLDDDNPQYFSSPVSEAKASL